MLRTKLIGLMVLVVAALSACGSPEVAATTSSTIGELTQSQRAAIAVESALAKIDLELSTQLESDVSLQMAWTDLKGDLISVVNENVRTPGSVDMVQMTSRVESFSTAFENDGWTPPPSWPELMEHLSTFATEMEVVAQSA